MVYWERARACKYDWWPGGFISVSENVWFGTTHLTLFLSKGSWFSYKCPEAWTSPMQRACVPFLTTWTMHTTFTSQPWGGKAHFIAPEMQRWSSSCCMSIITSLQVPSSRNTLLQTHCKAGGGGGLSQLGTGGQSHPDLQGQPALWWGHSSRPRHNYCCLHKQLWGIRMTNVRQPFKSRFWKIFLLQENAHVVGMKRKKKKGSKSKPAETITSVHLWVQLGLSSFSLRLMSANYQRENKKRRSYS